MRGVTIANEISSSVIIFLLTRLMRGVTNNTQGGNS